MEPETPATKAAGGCVTHGGISLGASILGSAIGAVVFTGWQVATSPFPGDVAPTENILLIGMVVMFMGALIGVPVGMVAGVPLLAMIGSSIPRNRIAMSLLLGFIGLAGGWVTGSTIGRDERVAGMIFGAAIGLMHGFLYPAERDVAQE
jgi:hypothetical protein